MSFSPLPALEIEALHLLGGGGRKKFGCAKVGASCSEVERLRLCLRARAPRARRRALRRRGTTKAGAVLLCLFIMCE